MNILNPKRITLITNNQTINENSKPKSDDYEFYTKKNLRRTHKVPTFCWVFIFGVDKVLTGSSGLELHVEIASKNSCLVTCIR